MDFRKHTQHAYLAHFCVIISQTALFLEREAAYLKFFSLVSSAIARIQLTLFEMSTRVRRRCGSTFEGEFHELSSVLPVTSATAALVYQLLDI